MGIIDPKCQLFLLIVNGQIYKHDIAPGHDHSLQVVNTTGGDVILNAYFPAITYDSVSDRIIAWDTGNTVYSLNEDTGVWTPISYPNGPTKVPNGTMGRFRYVPSLGVFVVLNSFNANAYVLRLTAPTPK